MFEVPIRFARTLIGQPNPQNGVIWIEEIHDSPSHVCIDAAIPHRLPFRRVSKSFLPKQPGIERRIYIISVAGNAPCVKM